MTDQPRSLRPPRFPFVRTLALLPLVLLVLDAGARAQPSPTEIPFVRQGVRRLVFDREQAIPLARLDPGAVIGMSAMHPVGHDTAERPHIVLEKGRLRIRSDRPTQSRIWFGGFNPYATYVIDLASLAGDGAVGFEFSDSERRNQFRVTVAFGEEGFTEARLRIVRDSAVAVEESISTERPAKPAGGTRIILQMLGSGLTLFVQGAGLPTAIGQHDFSDAIDLREKRYLHAFQSNLFLRLDGGQVEIEQVESVLSTGVGLADIRAITYENGDPLLDQGRLWYTMSIRGRALPHHLQGVFSMNPTVFDVRLEGVIVFDRGDGRLRNEIASHVFYDRRDRIWRGLTTGFSAYARPQEEEKQLLAVESERDPRFGFSVMRAEPVGIVGDVEDPHLFFDETAGKWRMLACVNVDGYRAVLLESDAWNRGYTQIAGPAAHNSTGTSIQKIGETYYAFSGSSEREIFVYSYPELDEIGTLEMDLPPWDPTSRTRVWPNVVQLPAGYPFRYVALMMDRYTYPGLRGPHWSYGALYLYHGYE